MEYDEHTQTQTSSDDGVKVDFTKFTEKERLQWWEALGKRICAGEPIAALSEETGITQAKLLRKRRAQSWWAWDAIREAVCMGIPVREVSRRFGPSPGAINKRAALEVWPTPRKIASMARSSKSNLVAKEDNVAPEETTPDGEIGQFEPFDPRATVEELAKQYEIGIAKLIMEKARQGALHLPPPRNWRDLKTADDIARRAAGLGKDAGKVATLFKVGFSNGGEPTVDVGVVVDLPSDDEA